MASLRKTAGAVPIRRLMDLMPKADWKSVLAGTFLEA